MGSAGPQWQPSLQAAGLVAFREPGEREKWLIFEPDGSIRGITGSWNLYVYHVRRGLPWAYEHPTPPRGLNPDPNSYSLDEIAPQITTGSWELFGYRLSHYPALSELASKEHRIYIWRARNPASLLHDENPDIKTKPEEVYVNPDGTNTLGDQLTPFQKTMLQKSDRVIDMSKIHTAPPETKGYLKDYKGEDVLDRNGRRIPLAGLVVERVLDVKERHSKYERSAVPQPKYQPFTGVDGKEYEPFEMDGKLLTGDYDGQAIYEIKADGTYDLVPEHGHEDFVRGVNSALNKGALPELKKDWCRHDVERKYFGLPKYFGFGEKK